MWRAYGPSCVLVASGNLAWAASLVGPGWVCVKVTYAMGRKLRLLVGPSWGVISTQGGNVRVRDQPKNASPWRGRSGGPLLFVDRAVLWGLRYAGCRPACIYTEFTYKVSKIQTQDTLVLRAISSGI